MEKLHFTLILQILYKILIEYKNNISYNEDVLNKYKKSIKIKGELIIMKKLLSLFLTIVFFAAFAGGCSQNASRYADESQSSIPVESDNNNLEITGSITMNGSTSMEKFATALNEAFMLDYPNVTATAEFTGSGAGIESVSNGSADIGNSSRHLKAEELANGLVENIVAIDGIAVVINTSGEVSNLTKQQLIDIYSGTVTNWKDVGGEDAQIVVIGRESASGTRAAFEELLELENACRYAQEIDSTGAVMAKVASTPGAIGYVSLDVVNDTVKLINLEGIEPTAENIKEGSYLLSRPFVMATKGEISEQSPAVQELFKFIDSAEGQEIISMVGLISAK